MAAVAVAHRPAPTFSARTVRRPRPRTVRPSGAEVVYRRRRLVAALLTLSVLLGGRMVADLAGSVEVGTDHLDEALAYRLAPTRAAA
jgi:hypothetical protein